MRNSSAERAYGYQEGLTSYSESTDDNIMELKIFSEEEAISMESISYSINTNRYVSYYFWKGILDRIFAAIGLIVSFPIFLLVAMLIKIDSKGPILFKQERIGVDSKPFDIYKFRTMHINAPNVPTNSLEDYDLYLTKIGSIIRKLSIDEIPQLINILKGEMSFIGPRPMIKDHEYLINMRRLKGIDILLPGISGLAQVNGRDEISDEKKLVYDEIYLNQFSIKKDITILLKTIRKVLYKEDITV